MTENASAPKGGKKIILSGIQPSGSITLGNYLGALRNWVALQDDPRSEYECRYFLADLHAITVRQEPAQLRRRIFETYALFMACGIDPERTLMFIQSHVPCHAELSWVLSCFTQFGELSRMTQFKDKSAKHSDNINAGLFTYPVLMAADILLYNSDFVPVGADQKQHLEIARDIAIRFNNAYSDTFTVPEPYIPKVGARICSLADPTKKMSKSDENENGWVAILDDRDAIMRKFRRAVTDSGSEIKASDDKPGVTNLMSIYAASTGRSFEDIEREFEGRGYGEFKSAVGETVADMLAPIQTRFRELTADKDYIEKMYSQNAERAYKTARKTLSKVYRKVGFLPLGGH